MVELWTVRIPEPSLAQSTAERAEAAGWDGIAYTDSQNLIGDPFVAMALGATVTSSLRFATGVTNAFTRHPAALATVAATVQETSSGRLVLGIGRGDTALFHLGRKPQPVDAFCASVDQLQTYLSGGEVDQRGFPSRLRWLDRAVQPKVPVSIAASGPRMITYAASAVERVTFALGADPTRVAWGLGLARSAAADAADVRGAPASESEGTAPQSAVAAAHAPHGSLATRPSGPNFGAYLNVGCHPDLDVARSLVAGTVAAFAHFSAMPGSPGADAAGLDAADAAVVAEVGRRYDSNVHLYNSADHTAPLHADFVDRFAVVGSPERCVERLVELVGLGLDHLVVTGPSFGGDADASRLAQRLLATEVLPGLRAALA